MQAPATGRAVAIAGDLTAPRLGLGERHDEIAAGVGTVIHSAASVAFDLPIEEARAINVEGTRRVLDFAGAVPDLQRVAYVSTAYVAGDRRGTVYEDDRETGDVPQLLRALQARGRGASCARAPLPWTIARPSIVVGESTTGWTASFNVLYGPLRAFAAGAYPGAARAPALAGRRRAGRLRRRRGRRARAPPRGGGRDLPPDRGRAGLERGGDHVADDGALRAPAPRLVPPRAYRRFLHPLVLRRVAPSTRRLLERSEVYFPYFAMRVRYDDARARALLEPMGIAAPRLERLLRADHRVRARGSLGQAARSTAAPPPSWRARRPTCARPCSARRWARPQCPREEAHGHGGQLGVVLDRAVMAARHRDQAAAGRAGVQLARHADRHLTRRPRRA